MAVKEELAGIVSWECVIDDPETLGTYSKDLSFAKPVKPQVIVKPRSSDEVQAIINWANQTATPMVPVSSGPPHFHGDTVPSVQGAVIVDLSGMKQVMRIDRRNRVAMIEPGVTYHQLQPELAKEGLRLSMPLNPRNSDTRPAMGITRSIAVHRDNLGRWPEIENWRRRHVALTGRSLEEKTGAFRCYGARSGRFL